MSEKTTIMIILRLHLCPSSEVSSLFSGSPAPGQESEDYPHPARTGILEDACEGRDHPCPSAAGAKRPQPGGPWRARLLGAGSIIDPAPLEGILQDPALS